MIEPHFAAIGAGMVVGFSLGLVGGGGSVLAVPLLVYGVGVPDAHTAIGTSAAAVAVSAFANLVSYARKDAVKWRCAAAFTLMGMAGARIGAEAAKAVDGKRLLALFGGAMIVIGLAMLRKREDRGDPSVFLSKANLSPLLPALLAMGLFIGALSGFFGIGGGFLIVPGLVFASGMPLANAIATSLVAVTAFGLTTAVTYAASGLIDWPLALQFIIGGLIGGLIGGQIGMYSSRKLAVRKTALAIAFSAIVIAVGVYVVARGILG